MFRHNNISEEICHVYTHIELVNINNNYIITSILTRISISTIYKQAYIYIYIYIYINKQIL